MKQNLRRLFMVILCVAMLTAGMTTVTFGQVQGVQEYASKVLYALDPGTLTHTAYGEGAVMASADNYPYVDVLGASDGMTVWATRYYSNANGSSAEYAGIQDHGDIVKALTAGSSEPDTRIKNITYKVVSSNPNGFEELNISFRGFAESNGGEGPTAFLAVQGAASAPEGVFDGENYFDNFSDLRRITDSQPGVFNLGRENSNPDFYDFGETLTLTNEIRGLREYYINFSYLSETLLGTGLSDISFAEKVPVEFSDTDKYDTLEIANGDVSRNGNGNFLWANQEWISNIPYWLGVNPEYYDMESVYSYGHPFFIYTNPEDISDKGFGFVGLGDDGFASITYKLVAPAGKTFQGLVFDYDGKVVVNDNATPYSGNAITTYIGDTATDLGVAKRYMSCTDSEGEIVRNVGTALDTFSVVGNNKNEIWVRLMIAGGQLTEAGYSPYNYLQKMKITAVFDTNKVSQGTEITDSSYASKVLYSMNSSALARDGRTAFTSVSDTIRTSADNYPSTEVLGTSDNITFYKLGLGNATNSFTETDGVLALIAQTGVRNITYKVTSTNPDGFDELDISFYGGVESPAGGSFLAVQGSSQAPIGEFEGKNYFNTFGDIRRITDSTPGEDNWSPYVGKDWYDYGETIVLTDAVKGKREYYINFSFASENYMTSWLSEITFTEKVKVDYTDDRYSTTTLTNMNYTGITNRNLIGYMWQAGDTNAAANAELIAATNEYCQVVDVKKWLMFLGDETTNWLGFPGDDNGQATYTSGAVVLKLSAPEGKIFKGLNVDLKGRNTIDACAGPNLSTSITVSVGNEYEAYNVPGLYGFNSTLAPVKRFMSYTDVHSVVKKNVGELTPFTVVGNNDDTIYLKITIAGGLDGWNYISSMKIDGIFAEKSIIEDIEFSGKGTFPTDGNLTAVYKIGAPEEGKEMPDSIMLVLAVYKTEENGTKKLVGVKAVDVNNPTINTSYTIELTGLPQDSEDCFAKAFVWSNATSMQPIGTVYRLGA